MKSELGRVKSESHGRAKCARCASFFTLHTSPFPLRHAVTLIELLITITIISILSASFLGVSNLAMESAREARTKTIIGKIHGLLMEKWASYETRRVDVSPALVEQLRSNIQASGLSSSDKRRALGQAMADLRLLATRELMKLEMPDRWSDLIGDTVGYVRPSASLNDFNVTNRVPRLLEDRPALAKSYLRRYTSLNTDVVDTIESNQGAECLYLIIMLSTGDGEARSLFSERDVGDTDGDGALEFLDGWGNSIQYVRWPAGFVPRSALMEGDADEDHDSFDPFRRDQEIILPSVPFPNLLAYPGTIRPWVDLMRTRTDGSGNPVSAYRLVPLVYSRGPDGNADLVVDAGVLVGLDPYVFAYGSSNNLQLATVDDINNDGDDNSIDNIHNHLQDNK